MEVNTIKIDNKDERNNIYSTMLYNLLKNNKIGDPFPSVILPNNILKKSTI